MKQMNRQLMAALFAMVCSASLSAQNAIAQSAQGDKSELAGLASVSGTVTSYAPFKAAKENYMLLMIILVVLIFGFGYGGYRAGPGLGYYGGGGLSLILVIVLVLLLLKVI